MKVKDINVRKIIIAIFIFYIICSSCRSVINKINGEKYQNLQCIYKTKSISFYISYDEKDLGIYKYENDRYTKLVNDNVMSAKYYKKCIYYINGSHMIYKILCNGFNNKKKLECKLINTIDTKNFIINNNSIFIYNNSDNKIYRITTDGKNLSKVSGDIICSYNNMELLGDYIFFQSNKRHIYKINTKRGGVSKVTNKITSNYHILGEWMYFTTDYGNKLYKVNIEKGTDIKLYSNAINQFIKVDRWIYFTRSIDKCVCRIDLDGNNFCVFFKKKIDSGCIDKKGKYIYFYVEQKENRKHVDVYRARYNDKYPKYFKSITLFK